MHFMSDFDIENQTFLDPRRAEWLERILALGDSGVESSLRKRSFEALGGRNIHSDARKFARLATAVPVTMGATAALRYFKRLATDYWGYPRAEPVKEYIKEYYGPRIEDYPYQRERRKVFMRLGAKRIYNMLESGRPVKRARVEVPHSVVAPRPRRSYSSLEFPMYYGRGRRRSFTRRVYRPRFTYRRRFRRIF